MQMLLSIVAYVGTYLDSPGDKHLPIFSPIFKDATSEEKVMLLAEVYLEAKSYSDFYNIFVLFVLVLRPQQVVDRIHSQKTSDGARCLQLLNSGLPTCKAITPATAQ